MIDVICIDPGITTGYAFGRITNDGLMEVVTGQERLGVLDLYIMLTGMAPDILVYEDFQFRINAFQKGLELFSVQLIGVANLYAQQKKIEVVAQTPATAIGQYYTDKKLKADMLYKTTTGGHANDACRHLLHWFTFRGGYKYNKKGYEPA